MFSTDKILEKYGGPTLLAIAESVPWGKRLLNAFAVDLIGKNLADITGPSYAAYHEFEGVSDKEILGENGRDISLVHFYYDLVKSDGTKLPFDREHPFFVLGYLSGNIDKIITEGLYSGKRGHLPMEFVRRMHIFDQQLTETIKIRYSGIHALAYTGTIPDNYQPI